MAQFVRLIDPSNQEHLINLDQVADVHFIQHEGKELEVVVTLAANSTATDGARPYQLRTRGERAQAFREAVYATTDLEMVAAPVTETQPGHLPPARVNRRGW